MSPSRMIVNRHFNPFSLSLVLLTQSSRMNSQRKGPELISLNLPEVLEGSGDMKRVCPNVATPVNRF